MSTQAALGPIADPLLVGKITLIFGFAWLALVALRRVSPAARHHWIVLAFSASVAVPFIEPLLPAWEVLPTPFTVSVEQSEVRIEQRWHPEAVAASPRAEPRPPAMPEARPATVESGFDLGSLVRIAPLAGLTITLALILVLAFRVLAIHRAVSGGRPLDVPSWTELLDALRSKLGVAREVQLRVHGKGRMPLVWGWRRPIILLPVECVGWTADRRRAVLAHELAHVARGDVPALFLSHLTSALHWFNPLVWILKRRLAVERELACDDAVIALGLDPGDYADHLLTIATRCRDTHRLAPVMARPSQLEERIMAILDPRRRRGGLSRGLRGTLIVLVLGSLLPLASLSWDVVHAAPYDTSQSGSDGVDYEAELRQRGIDLRDVDALIAGLDSRFAVLRAASAWALGNTGDRRAVDPLIAALDDRDDKVREWSVRSLGDLGDPRAVDPLVERIGDREAEVRQWSVRSLTKLGDSSVAGYLLEAIEDQDAEVREWVVRALGELEGPEARAGLIERLDEDEDAEVREWAARSLAAIEAPTEARWERNRAEEEPLMPGGDRKPQHRADPEVVSALVRALASEEANVLEWSARSLAELGAVAAVDPLIGLTTADNLAVREWAIRSLGTIGDPRAVDALVDSLSADNAVIREWSARSLGVLGDARMVDPLIASLDDDSAIVREWAVRVLGDHGDRRAVDHLYRRLEDESPHVRRWAKRALEHLGEQP